MVKTKPYSYVQVAIQGWPIVMGRTVCVLDGPVFRVSSIGLTHFGISLVGGI